MKKIYVIFMAMVSFFTGYGQIDARLMQHPDVSDSHIAFTYGDDIYIVDKAGGVAHQLTSPQGPEFYPRFSPDGKYIAYTANYNGNFDVYVIPAMGGVPKRLTYHGMPDMVQGWTPDGKSVLFTSLRESGKERFSKFFTVSAEGGTPTRLPIPYGEFASYSSDGNTIAYTDRSRVNRNWKRYRGGTAPDIMIFDLTTFKTENITNNAANDETPMWVGNSIYYMSDNGPEKRNNIWKYDVEKTTNTQITQFKDFDITFPANGKDEIVFEAGGNIYLLNLNNGISKEVNIQVINDQRALIPTLKNVAENLQSATISPDGKRVVVQARGELFDLPATEGFVSNISQNSGTAERYPAWSPDGKSLAYWSDASGEYQLMIRNMTKDTQPIAITNFTSGFNYEIFWSPNSKKIVSINQAMEVQLIDVATGSVKITDHGKYMFEGNLRGFKVSWSPDSRYFIYSMSKENRVTSSLFLYDTQNNQLNKLTSGFYNDADPVFSSDGNYIFYTTGRTFQPVYSDVDNTFVYPNSTNIAVGTVNKSVASISALKNDEPEVKEDKKEETSNSKTKKKGKKESEPAKPEIKSVIVDVNGFEERIELLDIENGNLANLATVEGKLLFIQNPNTGSGKDAKNALQVYDIKDQKTKTIMSGVGGYVVSADGKKILVLSSGKLAVVDVAPDQKPEKFVPTQNMAMNIIPKEEWKQIFNDVWRFERDYFYDPNMHGVDWNLMRTRYGSLVDQANSRTDVNIILGDLIAELNASHTYVGGGDLDAIPRKSVGYLGADIVVENGAFRIKKIIQGAPWDVEVKSPLLKPGVNINEGDYILEINGQKTDISQSIYASLQGLAEETIQLTVNSTPSMTNAKKVLVKPLSSELRLRNLAWINDFRKRVDAETGGKIGYIFVPSTGRDGQNELFRQFYGQMNKQGFIIDERFNNGGQIPDRFVELLDRDPLAFWAVRDGQDWAWPPAGNFGPKVMLINGFAGSGGDAFPDYFRKRGVGPLIGTRTWGGLIGISGAPELIDGGGITVPTFRMYDPDGTWFKEGHGVDPDIEVVEDFESLAKGIDAQLEAAIKEVIRLLNGSEKFNVPNRPTYEKRN